MVTKSLLGLLLLFALCHCKSIQRDSNGLHYIFDNEPGPKYTFWRPEDRERFGVYEFEFLGLAEAEGDSIIQSTYLHPKHWTFSPLKETDTQLTFSFNYTAANGTESEISGIHIKTELDKSEGGDPSVWLTFNFENYSWQTTDLSVHLVAIFKLTNSYNYSAAVTNPERIQVGYGFFSIPQFAIASYYEGFEVARVVSRCYAPPNGANFTYWVTYERFTFANLEHKIQLGYGLPSRPDISSITLGTAAGVILLSFCVMMLVIFGKKLENSRYGRQFEQITKYD